MTIYYNKYMGAGITGLLLIVSSIMVFGWPLCGTFDRFKRSSACHAFSTAVTAVGAALATFSNSGFYFNPWTTFFGFLIVNFGFGFLIQPVKR